VHSGRQQRNVRLADLGGEPWVLPPADTMHGSLTGAGGAEMPRAPVTTLSMHLCCRLVASGRFVAILPVSILRFGGHDQALKRLPIKLPAQPRPVGIVTLKNRTLSPVAKLFIECVHRVLVRTPKA
jgi:DNA-binding transcriptional LysR family regulator